MRKNLFSERKHNGYTQVQVANMLGITERHYQNLESGTSNGSVEIWQKLKVILHAKSIDYLLEQVVDTPNFS